MVYNLGFTVIVNNIRHAGHWFWLILTLWLVLYLGNTLSWYLIIKAGKPKDKVEKINFFWLYKVTISAFSLNYATPGGLMGGEPYRIMELTPKIGTERATSSVLLFVMTHIFSHFIFWLFAIFLFLLFEPFSLLEGVVAAATGIVLLLGIAFFLKAYKYGLAVKLLELCNKIPLIKRYSLPFIEKYYEQLQRIDQQISALKSENRFTFFSVVFIEFVGRIISSFEIMFIILIVNHEVSFVKSLIIIAYTSLIANLLFFMPLQLGGREGGFILSSVQLGFSASSGSFLAIIVRIRELIWTGIGLLLIKLDRKKNIKLTKGKDD